jgi:hypothetical protein
LESNNTILNPNKFCWSFLKDKEMNLFPVILQADNRIIPDGETLIKKLADFNPKYPAEKYHMGVVPVPFLACNKTDLFHNKER